MKGRTIGLWLAILAALAAAGLIGWSVYTQVTAGARAQSASADDAQMGPVPQGPAAAIPESGAGDIRDIVEGAERFQIVGMDRNDPSRVAYELAAETIDPLPGGRYSAANPRAWIYMGSGAVIRVRAETATFLRPAGVKEPESGRFSGAVRISVHPPEDAPLIGPGALDLAPENEPAPLLVMTTDALTFDAILGEISTADHVRIQSSDVEASFVGMKANFDELRRRLAFFEAGAEGVIRYRPSQRADDESAAPAGADAAARPARSSAAQPAPKSPAEPLLDWYRAEFTQAVRLVADGRTIEADALELWSRIVDGALPEGAIARLGAGDKEQDDAESPSSDSSAPQSSDSPDSRAQEIMLTWSGPLTIRPLRSEPAELSNNHMAARFTAPVRGVVTLQDPGSGASGRCSALDYGFTSAQLVLTAPVATGVTLTMPDAGEVVTGRFELGLKDGVGALPGPGVLRAIGQAAQPSAADPYAAPPARDIAWQERCDLIFATRDGSIDFSDPAPLREAMFHRSVLARDGATTLRGEFLRASFNESPEGAMTIRRVVVEGEARADAGADGRLGADRLDASFVTGPRGRVAPAVVTAQGRVRGEREGETLNAEFAEVSLGRDDQGELRVETFSADHAVRVTRRSGMETLADSLRVNTADRAVEIVGEPAVVHYKGGSITGGSMRYHEDTRRLTVFGPGVFNYSQPRVAASGYERAQIEWSGAMEYDDDAGRAEFIGDCVATARPNDLASDTARGGRIVLDLAPRVASSAERQSDADPELRLVRATVYGAMAEGDSTEPARIETRRYAPDDSSESGLRLERLLYLDGPVVVAEAERDVLHVPGAGRLLIEDRRPDEASRADTDPSLRGTTLFEWDGEMTIDRAKGHAQMVRRVRLRQRPPGDAPVTELESEHLNAWIKAGADAPDDRPELLRAEAVGAVYVRQKSRQLIADRLTYDGAAGMAEAVAAPGNFVTLFEETRTAPLTGSVMRWDLIRDRVEWFDAQTTTAPR